MNGTTNNGTTNGTTNNTLESRIAPGVPRNDIEAIAMLRSCAVKFKFGEFIEAEAMRCYVIARQNKDGSVLDAYRGALRRVASMALIYNGFADYYDSLKNVVSLNEVSINNLTDDVTLGIPADDVTAIAMIDKISDTLEYDKLSMYGTYRYTTCRKCGDGVVEAYARALNTVISVFSNDYPTLTDEPRFKEIDEYCGTIWDFVRGLY